MPENNRSSYWWFAFASLKRPALETVQAVAQGCTYRLGPELEIPGYGCEDHFLEADTIDHSWEVVMDLAQSGYTDTLVVDVGMPVIHNGVRYNCKVIMLRKKILLIRPKLHLAQDGNYREGRYFATWKKPGLYEFFKSASSYSCHNCLELPDPCTRMKLSAQNCLQILQATSSCSSEVWASNMSIWRCSAAVP